MADPFLRSLEKDGHGGAFYLHGEDEFRKDETARRLVELHLDPATRDFNYDLLRGSEVDVEHLASVLATPPMMAEWRVVLLRETEALASSPKARELVTSVAADPPPGLALILVATVPGRSKAKFYRTLASSTRSVEFPAVDPDDAPGWLVERARAVHDLELEPDAARALAQAIGSDLGVLSQELEKLAGFVGDAGSIGRADVEAAGTRLPAQDRWAWFDLVGERRFREALEGLRILMDQGESGVGLAIGLGTHLLRIGVAAARGRQALEDVLPPHQRWLARRLEPQARRWRAEEVEAAVEGLLRADRLMKSSSLGDGAILEEWLLGLLAGGREAA